MYYLLHTHTHTEKSYGIVQKKRNKKLIHKLKQNKNI